MRSSLFRFGKNAASNMASGASSAVLAVVLPYFFVRYFSRTEFSLWVLVLQLAAYVNYFDFGVQLAIGRYVALSIGRGDRTEAEDTVSTGVQLLSVLGLAAFLVIGSLAALLPVIFTKIQPDMVHTGRIMLLWIGGSLVIGLPFTAFNGVFVGLQRNDIPAAISLVSRAGLALALIFVGARTHDLTTVAKTYFFVSLLGYLLQYIFFKALCPDWRLRPLAKLPSMRRELISYCATLTAWSIAMLLINGMSTAIVGYFDFKDVGAFGVGLSILAFYTGALNAIFSPLLQVFTHRFAQDDLEQLVRLFGYATNFCTVLLLLTGYWMMIPAPLFFRWWVGPQMAQISVPVFSTLVLANIIRNHSLPYAQYLLAAGEQRKVYASPIAEGLTNFVSSVILAHFLGAIGVAWGAVLGGLAGVLANYLYNFRRTLPHTFSFSIFVKNNVIQPLTVTSPLLLALLASFLIRTPVYIMFILMVCLTLPTIGSLRKDLKMFRSHRAEAF